MHRLLSTRNFYQSGLHTVVIPVNSSRSGLLVPEIKCSFCQKILFGQRNIEYLYHIRHQSTRTASALKAQRNKKKNKSFKKYAELLEVNNQAMTETKIMINNFNLKHFSKLASSSISLGQLHELTKKPKLVQQVPDVDPELLKSFEKKILQSTPSNVYNQSIDQSNQSQGKDPTKNKIVRDVECALVYTSHHHLSNIKDMLLTKQYVDKVKESYYNFKKTMKYKQKLQDVRHAINEGVSQEFEYELANPDVEVCDDGVSKGPHAIFRQLLASHQYDEETFGNLLEPRNKSIPEMEDIFNDSSLYSQLAETKEYLEDEQENISAKLKVKKAKQSAKKAKKKRQAILEQAMKEDMKAITQRGKQETLHNVLMAHLQLLCSQDSVDEANQLLEYYRQWPQKYKVTDVKVYNIILHGYAAKGQYDCVQSLLSTMTKEGIHHSPQTYAAIFECIERGHTTPKEALLKTYQEQMSEKGIKLNDVMDKSNYLYDQREVVLKAIRRIEPDFQPQYTPLVIDYDCPLLENLKLDRDGRKGLFQSPAEGILTLEEIEQRGKEQLEIEMKGEIEVENVSAEDNPSPTVVACRKRLDEVEKEWRQVARVALTRHMNALRQQCQASKQPIKTYPYMTAIPMDQLIDLIIGEIHKLLGGSDSYSPSLRVLQRELGTNVYKMYKIDQFRRNGSLEKLKRIYSRYCEWYLQRGGEPHNSRQTWQLLLHQDRNGPDLNADVMWPLEIRQSIGKFLYNIILNDIKIDVNMFNPKAKKKLMPAMYKVHRTWNRMLLLEVKAHPVLVQAWQQAVRKRLRMAAALLPSKAPPRPWVALSDGAYLLTDTPLIRLPLHMTNQWKRMKEAPPASLHPVYDSLNQLGEVPWTINQPILDLQLKIFKSGGDRKLDIAPPPSALDVSQFSDVKNAYKRRTQINRTRAEMYSLWCDALYKLSLANHYRGKTFWLPHNMDFRGRVYACPPHVTQLGADPARALLVFAKRRPLGPSGLRWLKLHVINLTGTVKRLTVDQRLEYVESIMDKILDSARKPLDGEGWWKKSEEPWQTLACCMEIANALECPNPEEYECGFPVHQDGSCNGLQHYAALGGDSVGAASVNLAPLADPQDVYSAVVALVEKARERDAAAGVKTALILENFIKRKVIKQTVMTTVYGVTKFGARLQIAKQLKDIDTFPKEHVWECSQYLTTKTFNSIEAMFTSTKKIQDWFTDCAKLISGVCGTAVEWVTPLGLPVVQPYYRHQFKTSGLHQAAVDHTQRPCPIKQRNAFPPNFIHSLDSTHMMLTGLYCEAKGVTFVSVHDCFWTHPDTVDVMNQICREQFVALHSQPILEDLSDFLVKQYSYAEDELKDSTLQSASKKRVNNTLKQVPPKGDFDINGVLKSVYFFS